MHPAREAQRRDEQMHAQPLLADPYPCFAEVDLQLPSGRRLEPHRRACLRLQFPAPARDPTLDMAQAEHNAMFSSKLLADHIGVAAMLEEPRAQPFLQPIQNRSPCRLPERRRTSLAKISSHRVARASKLARQPLGSPAKPVQSHHRRHLVRLQHLLSPRHRSTRARVA